MSERLAKAGRVLSAANERALEQAAKLLDGVLAQVRSTEPAAKADVVPLTKQQQHSGAMIALFPSAEVAQTLAQPGGEPAGDLHVTLAYLGDAADLTDVDRLAAVVAGFAAACPPITAQVSGPGYFTAITPPASVALIDAPGLSDQREELADALCSAGFEPSMEHGFTPHITLAYDGRTLNLPTLPVMFDTITLALAGERRSWPLTGPVDEDDDESEDAATPIVKMERVVPVWKDDSAQIVYGVVLQPGVTDSQGDRVSAAEIEQAAHRYLVESRDCDTQHDELPNGVEVVESFIAPADLEVAGRRVLKGAWVLATHIPDPDLWQRVVKGEITGYSIGGSAVRVAK